MRAAYDEAPAGGAARGFRETSTNDPYSANAEHALLTIEGGDYATAYLMRLRASQADAGGLATLVQFMRDGPMLAGFCRVIVKALRGACA